MASIYAAVTFGIICLAASAASGELYFCRVLVFNGLIIGAIFAGAWLLTELFGNSALHSGRFALTCSFVTWVTYFLVGYLANLNNSFANSTTIVATVLGFVSGLIGSTAARHLYGDRQ